MSETISLFLGTPSIKISSQYWNQLSLQHAITAEGRQDAQSGYPGKYFSHSEEGVYLPRAIMVDSTPTLIDSLRAQPIAKVLKQENLISGHESTRGVWQCGSNLYYEVSQNIIDSLRRELQTCDAVECVNLFYSFLGGVSGIASKLLQQIQDMHLSALKMVTAITDTNYDNYTGLQLFNAKLSFLNVHNLADSVLFLDNSALNSYAKQVEAIYDNKRGYRKNNIRFTRSPSKGNEFINQIAAKALADLSANMRFRSSNNLGWRKMSTNLIAFPKAKYLQLSYAPIAGSLTKSADLFQQLFRMDRRLSNTYPHRDRYITNYMCTIGAIESFTQETCCQEIRDRNCSYFMEYTQSNISSSNCVIPNTEGIRGVTVYNSLDIRQKIKNLNEIPQRKKGFRYLYQRQGFDTGLLAEAEQAINEIAQQYTESHYHEDQYDEEEMLGD